MGVLIGYNSQVFDNTRLLVNKPDLMKNPAFLEKFHFVDVLRSIVKVKGANKLRSVYERCYGYDRAEQFDWHNAMADVEATVGIARKLFKTVKTLYPRKISFSEHYSG